MPNHETETLDKQLVERQRKSIIKVDMAIGIICMVPLASFFWLFSQDDRFSMDELKMILMLYLWSVGSCYLLVLRKIKDKGMRSSSILFTSGTFCLNLVLTFSLLPSMWAIAATPIVTYYVTRIRTGLHRQIDLLAQAGGSSNKREEMKA